MKTDRHFGWPNNKRAALSLSFDDARPSQLDRGIPILDAHGVRGTFYASLRTLKQRADDWRRAAGSGHEIGNHTTNHPCSSNFWWMGAKGLEGYTLQRMDAELTEATTIIEQTIGVTPVTFAYPCGHKFVNRGINTKSYVPLVAKHFLAGRGFRDEMPNDPIFCDLAQLCGVDADHTPFEDLHRIIKIALDHGGWLVLVAHDIGEKNLQTMTPETLAQLCAFAQDPQNGIWIDTVATIAQYVKDHAKPADRKPRQTVATA